ncbi:MAG: hypothetical protein R2873_28680 [Caldilineaceae bacterium]
MQAIRLGAGEVFDAGVDEEDGSIGGQIEGSGRLSPRRSPSR